MMENNLIVLEPNPKSFESARLITTMFLYCEAFYDVSEKNCGILLKKQYQKLKHFMIYHDL
jgi:hypothetical protein